MVTNTNQAGDARRISVQCSCGKRLSALPQHAGKRLKCPACGQVVVMAANPSPPPMAVSSQVDDEPEGMSKTALWSIVGVSALACILFLVWHSHSSHQAKIAAANGRISQAIATAQDMVAGNSPLDGEAVERTLAEALGDQFATEKSNGESVLDQVRQRREQLAEKASVEQAQRQATRIWDDAKRQIDANHITEAIILLRKYVADPHATDAVAAQRLLAEAETVSDMLTIDALIAMTDEEFGRVKTSGEIQDGKVTHPVLTAARTETVQRNLNKAAQRREENRFAELTRQREEEAQRRLLQAREPLRVFLGGELSGAQAAYYRLLPAPELFEVQKNDSGSVFDKADQPRWESKFAVENIALAPGAVMRVSVENYADSAFGQHSEWSWGITVAQAVGAKAYQGISFDNAVGGAVDSWLLQLTGTAELNGMTLHRYQFQERRKILTNYETHSPIDKILRRMTSGDAVKYRISTGPKGIGPAHEGEFSRETTQGLIGLLRTAKYKNWMDKSEYLEKWMRP